MAQIDNFKIMQAQEAIRLTGDEIAERAEKYFNDDHWQKGDAWIGPRPPSGEEGSDSVMEEIQRGFIFENAVAEIVGRHRDAVIGKEPEWSLVPARVLKDDEKPSKPEQIAIEEAHTALISWWDKKRILKIVEDATRQLLLGEKAYLRIFIPSGLIDDAGAFRKKPKSISDVLDMLYLSVALRETTTIYTHEESQEKIGIHHYRYKNLTGEVQDFEDYYELHGLDDQGFTIVRVLKQMAEANDSEGEASTPLDLGGHLEIFELSRDRFVTPAIMSLQNKVNMAWTMGGRNDIQGGFLERTILNAQMPGTFVDDPANPGKKIFQPNPLYVGAGVTNMLSGLPIFEQANSTNPNAERKIAGYTNPSVVYRDPIAPDNFHKSRDAAYAAILGMASQRHEIISGDATASGESRKQALASFEKSLRPTKLQVEMAIRWLLETALWMAAGYANQPQFRKLLRAQVQCRVDMGAPSSDEINTVINLKKESIISGETAMTRVGIDDPDAERAKIAAETVAQTPAPPDVNNPPQQKGATN